MSDPDVHFAGSAETEGTRLPVGGQAMVVMEGRKVKAERDCLREELEAERPKRAEERRPSWKPD